MVRHQSIYYLFSIQPLQSGELRINIVIPVVDDKVITITIKNTDNIEMAINQVVTAVLRAHVIELKKVFKIPTLEELINNPKYKQYKLFSVVRCRSLQGRLYFF